MVISFLYEESKFKKRAAVVIAISIWLLVALYFTVRAMNDARMKTELGKAMFKAIETINEIEGQFDENQLNMIAEAQKAIPFNLIDTETMEVVSYPAVSEEKSATIFLFW